MYSCHSILECFNLFSRVKLSIRSFCFISQGYCHFHSGIIIGISCSMGVFDNENLGFVSRKM